MVAESPAPPATLRSLLASALLAALSPLVPLPFLDDWALERVRRRMVRARFAERGIRIDKPALKQLLAREHGSLLLGCLGIAVYPLKLVLGKVFFFLAARRCAHLAADVFQEGFLVEHALAAGQLDGAALGDPARLEAVARAMRAAIAGLDPGPLRQAILRTLRGSRTLVMATASFIARAVRRRRGSGPGGHDEAAPADAVAPDLLDRLVEAVWYRRDYLEELARRFDAALTSGPAGGTVAGPSSPEL